MAEVRKAVEKNPNLGKELQESNRFESSMVPLTLTFKQLDSNLQIGNLTKEVLEASTPMKKFLSEHVIKLTIVFN